MKQPKPFFRRQTKSWYLQLGKRQINLGRNKKEAWTKYYELMNSREEIDSFTAVVTEVLDAYLDWCHQRRAEATYKSAKRYLSLFAQTISKRMQVRSLKPLHISQWILQHPTWGDTTQNEAIGFVQRAMNWAQRQGIIDRSPLGILTDKPQRRQEVVYSPEKWREILSHVKDQPFNDLLTFLWTTRARPFEARIIEADHVDVSNEMVVLPPSKNKTRKGERVIFLNEDPLKICRRLSELHPCGPIFRNTHGRPWTKDAIKCRFARIKKKVNIEGLCAYGIRHSYATEGLKNGVDAIVLALLMGHPDVNMIARTYQHLSRNPEFLRKQARRATGRDV